MKQDLRDLFSLKGKNAVLTGAGGFFGGYFAEALLTQGIDRLFCIDISQESLALLGARLSGEFGSGRFQCLPVDQDDEAQSKEAFAGILRQHRIDILINNSYQFGGKTGFSQHDGRIQDSPLEYFRQSLVSGACWPFLATQAFGNAMTGYDSGGSIVNIGSMYAIVSPNPDLYAGGEYYNPPGYSAGKAALLALTGYAAAHYGPKVRVNALCPGAIPNLEKKSDNSEQNRDPGFMSRLVGKTLLKRVGHPRDLVGAIVYLASDASSYMTGHAMVVDGGWTVT